MLEDSLRGSGSLVDKLLCDETGSSKHGKSAVLNLLGLHGLKLGRVFRAEAERIETNVSRGVVVTEEELLLRVRGANPPNLGTIDLRDSNEEDKSLPERRRDLREVVDTRTGDLRVKEERGSLNLLTSKETNEGKHRDATVGQLSLAITLALVLISVFEKPERIKVTYGGKSSRKARAERRVRQGSERAGLR